MSEDQQIMNANKNARINIIFSLSLTALDVSAKIPDTFLAGNLRFIILGFFVLGGAHFSSEALLDSSSSSSKLLASMASSDGMLK